MNAQHKIELVGRRKFRPSTPRPVWPWVIGVAGVIIAVQGWLVARAGTDVPFYDQWDVEGKWLYPAWLNGTLHLGDLLRPHNEHRIFWSNLLDLCLFGLNGQWDPLLEMAVGAVLHASCAGLLTLQLAKACSSRRARWGIAIGVTLISVPLAAWHNALWSFQTQVYFALLFSLLSMSWLSQTNPSPCKAVAGLAAMLAMGSGELLAVALLGLVLLRVIEKRHLAQEEWRSMWAAIVLMVTALALMASAPISPTLRASSASQFISVLFRLLAWPHSDQPLAALVLNLPLMLLVIKRINQRRQPRVGENFVLLIGGWAAANALAVAWARGGGMELQAGVPSRYVDFLVLLPFANAWCAIVLAVEAIGKERSRVRVLAVAWCGFLFIGWLGVSLQMWRGIVQPRMRDRLAPVRLMVAFQESGNPAVFTGQPRLYVPYPQPESILPVLRNPRMQGALPPSLQPTRPMGPLSRLVRILLEQKDKPN